MIYWRYLYAGAISIGLIGLGACGSIIEPVVQASSTDVYLAGFEQGNGAPIAMYWKNGVAYHLTNNAQSAIAEGIAVSGNDVYVVGQQRGPTGHILAMLWKNGVATALTDGTKDGYANGIVISGTDVYVCGDEIGLNASGDPYSAAEYWKNGVPTILSNSAAGQGANAISVSGSDVYVGGFQNKTTQTPSGTSTYPVSLYWKNGVPIALTNGSAAAGAFAIFVSGGDLFVSGYNCLVNASGCERAAYWVNGSLMQLPTSNASTAAGITAANGNIYIADNEAFPPYGANEAVLWANGNENDLGLGAANAVAVLDQDIYIAGAGSEGIAGYFKNGNFQQAQTDANMDSSAFAIAVGPR